MKDDLFRLRHQITVRFRLLLRYSVNLHTQQTQGGSYNTGLSEPELVAALKKVSIIVTLLKMNQFLSVTLLKMNPFYFLCVFFLHICLAQSSIFLLVLSSSLWIGQLHVRAKAVIIRI